MTRKKRQPKPVLNPLMLLAPMRSAEIQRIMTHYYMALDNLMSGRGTERDLFVLLKVCELGYIALTSDTFIDVDEATEAVVHTARGIRHAAIRVEEGKNAGLDGVVYQTLKRLLAQIEFLFETTSITVVKRWLDIQERSIRTGVFQCLNHTKGLLAPLDAHGQPKLTKTHPVVVTSQTAWGLCI